MSTPQSPTEMYTQSFAGETSDSKVEKALAVALDIRKFEIELYWKRATYFWVFTGAALAGYLAALTSNDIENRPYALLLTSCIGLVFAVAWYFVNRASKYWQSNWEAHADLLEDRVNGPAYKTVLAAAAPWWKLHGPYAFSVSKINQLLSLFVVAIFLLLIATTLNQYYVPSRDWELLPTACIGVTFGWLVLFVWLGRSGQSNRVVSAQLRKTTIEKYLSDD